jgi:redox-sensitive bicupin YhaK (pirin superfamily)
VRRLLPSPARQMVGPFIFFDQMGPVAMEPGRGLDVRPHPHINLATVTYLFEGEILHRDSLGSEQGDPSRAVNWMTAGRGIVHSERSPGERAQDRSALARPAALGRAAEGIRRGRAVVPPPSRRDDSGRRAARRPPPRRRRLGVRA